jgi:hypothetical protein
MGNRGDILVHSDDFKLIVRVKGGGQSSADLAARFRYSLVEHELIPKTEYFLLAFPDYLYLWKEKNILETVPPDYIVRTFSVLKKYLSTSDTEPKLIIKEALRMALSHWLRAVALSPERPPVGSDAHKILVESGLLDAIDQREVVTEIHL